MLFNSKKERKLRYFNIISSWFDEYLINFTFDKSKTRYIWDSFLQKNWVSEQIIYIPLCFNPRIKNNNRKSVPVFQFWNILNYYKSASKWYDTQPFRSLWMLSYLNCLPIVSDVVNTTLILYCHYDVIVPLLAHFLTPSCRLNGSSWDRLCSNKHMQQQDYWLF